LSKNGCTSATKTISCPRCLQKKRKNKFKGEIGKISIKIGNNNDHDGWSGEKQRTCPVCKQQVRFEYQVNGNGQVRIIIK